MSIDLRKIFDTDSIVTDQTKKINKLLSKIHNVEKHLYAIDKKAESDIIRKHFTTPINDILNNAAVNKLTVDEMEFCNQIWKQLNEKYPNI